MKIDPYMKGFMDCLKSEKKGVFIRHLFVDLNDGNWSDAALFSQICYIFSQLNEDGYKHYSIHEHDNQSWISLSYAQWWNVCRLNQSTVKAVIKRVQDRSLIVTKKIHLGASNRLLIRIDYEQFSKRIQSIDSISPSDRIDLMTPIDSISPSDRIDLMTIYKDPEDPEGDPKEHSLRNPERVCEEMKNDTEPESLIVPDTPKTLPVFSSPIGDDNFSAAAPRNSSTEGFPIGPWGQDLFSIHAGFMAAVIGKWRKGDTQKAKTFGSMVDEEVRGCIQKYWKKDWTNLQLDWTEYEDSTKRLAQTVRDRMAQGVEISTQEQKILTDRVMGPEHLRHQASDSVPQQALLTPERVQRQASIPIGILPVAITGISESDLEETKRAIEAARPKVVAMNQSLFQGREPIEAFRHWLEQEAEKHHVPGLSRRLIALSLGRRPEMQAAYLESLNHEF
jgi:hypothetical protein